MHPTPALLPGESYGRRSLVGCSPWGCKESDTTERLHFHFSLSCIGEGNGNPPQCSWLENPRDGVAWWAAVYGVAQGWTRLKWFSSSSSHVLAVWPSASCLTTLGLSFSIYKNDRCVAILPPNSTQFMTCEFEETRTVPEIHGKQLNSAWYVL